MSRCNLGDVYHSHATFSGLEKRMNRTVLNGNFSQNEQFEHWRWVSAEAYIRWEPLDEAISVDVPHEYRSGN